jgi:hypothetical protein
MGLSRAPTAVDVAAYWRELSSEAVIANVSKFSVATYQRKPRHWRAAIFPEARTEGAPGDTVRSVVTPDYFPSEAKAQLAAEQLIRRL